MSPKWKCDECGWCGSDEQLLREQNPFADDIDTMVGCPECREPNSMSRACDHESCWQIAGNGTSTPEGYKWTCFKHRPDAAK
jgi:hypothetical protein